VSIRSNSRPLYIKATRSRRSFIASSVVTAVLPMIAKANLIAEQTKAESIATDSLRPQYHLLPKANWMNDPNGPIYWNGQYHLFFQYNPDAAVWGDMHWAHAVSPDMIHWRHMPLALSPSPQGPDRDGCFSGSTVVRNGVPTILYTGVASTTPEQATLRDGKHNFQESQCIATSASPDLRSWVKSPRPVIPRPPHGVAITGFRDPCVWWSGSSWWMLLGSGFAKVGGCALLYRSSDLHHWEYLHPLLSGTWNGLRGVDPVDSGEMWECPDFFPLGSKHVLIYSTERKVYWTVGELDSQSMTFHPEKKGLLDTGAFYAPKTMLDRAGNRILWGWIPETRPEKDSVQAGWAGLASLPRLLSLQVDNSLGMQPISSLDALRMTSSVGGSLSFGQFCGEAIMRFARSGQDWSVTLGSTNRTYMRIHFRSPFPDSVFIDGVEFSIPMSEEKLRQLRIFMDGSVIEIFIDKSLAHTKRVYELDLDSPQTRVSVSGHQDVAVWQLRPISQDRLTTN
jgi:beta-fructofuranosidase